MVIFLFFFVLDIFELLLSMINEMILNVDVVIFC